MKSTYNTLKEDWTIDDMLTIIVLEENSTKAYKGGGVVNMVTVKKHENEGATKWEVKKQHQSPKDNHLAVTPTTKFKCYFCKKDCHIKRNCKRYKKWFENNKDKAFDVAI
ncbi:unnamed protein product [Prunus armeniaca]